MKTERRLITIATRDENLKKINAELEKLDDEQLEQVAGGGWIDCKIPTTTTDSNQLGNVVGKRFIPPSIC